MRNIKFSCLGSPTKGEGVHVGFSADPGRRRQRRRDSLYPPYFLNQWVEFCYTCKGASVEQVKRLIKFW